MSAILEVKDLRKTFYKNNHSLAAVDGISFTVGKGECLGLVGESGCGKSTAAKLITGLEKADSGEVKLCGHEVLSAKSRELREIYAKVQMVFQTPQDSFDPRKTLGNGIMEGIQNRGMKRQEAKKRLEEVMEMVELPMEYAGRYPHQVSGGQCQRAAIARALAPNPDLIICDEATSALDVTVQAQIVKLLERLQSEMEVAFLFICHDLALVQAICDRVLVMYNGKIVEEGTPDEVIMHPKEEYTKRLIDSVF